MRKPLNCPYCVIVLETFEFFFFGYKPVKKKSKQELGKLEIFFDSVHEQIEKRIMLLSDLSNHGGEVETRVRLFSMSSTTIIAIND